MKMLKTIPRFRVFDGSHMNNLSTVSQKQTVTGLMCSYTNTSVVAYKRSQRPGVCFLFFFFISTFNP